MGRRTIVSVWALLCATFPALGQTTDAIEVISLRNSNGLQADILPVGATIQRLIVPDRDGIAEDIVLGYDSPKHYQTGNSPYFGGVVGRVANRIAGAHFTLDGATYNLTANDRGNTLHGGADPLFENSTWQVLEVGPQVVVLGIDSPAGAQGFPGNLNVTVTYALTDGNELRMTTEATSDADTPVNLAQHSYFNLNGQARGSVLNHVLQINGSYITPTDINQIPTGQLAPVQGTPFDFTQPHAIGERIQQVTWPPPYGGYDYNWALFGLGEDAANKTFIGSVFEEAQLAATVVSPLSGRAMDLSTNAPGLQFYAGDDLNGSVAGKGAYLYPQYGGMALEAQVWPDYLHRPNFPQSILRAGQVYRRLWNLRFYNAT